MCVSVLHVQVKTTGSGDNHEPVLGYTWQKHFLKLYWLNYYVSS